MSTLLAALGRWSYRRPWRVIFTWMLLLGLAGTGALTLGTGTDNSFSIPGTESEAGIEQLSRTFPQVSGTSAQLVVVTDNGAPIEEAPYFDAITDAVADFEGLTQVSAANDPFSEMVNGLVSAAGDAAIVRLQFDGQSSDVTPATLEQLEQITTALDAALPDGVVVALGGDLFSQDIPALSLTEVVGLIIALLVLVVTFRSFVVAGLPLLTALLGVGLSMALIFFATAFAPISATTPLLALMLGLAVGIDYTLFIVARHQDQVREGVELEESAARATGTAGSAVVFAGITVLIALIGLSFAGIPFLTTMGIAAAVAVAISVLVAVTLTPALLGLVKGRVIGRAGKSKKQASKNTGGAVDAPAQATATPKVAFSRRWVRLVMKHPIITTVAVVAGLGLAAVPLSGIALALPNAGMLPADSQARQSYDLASEHFGEGFNGPLILTGTIVTSTDPLGLMEALADDVARIPGVETIALSTPNETADTGIVQVIPTTAPDDPATADLVRELRAQHDRWLDEYGIDIKVTGFTAVAIDISDRLGAALIPFGLFVIGLSLVLLTIVFRSIWVPIKATLGYLLSVGAAFGAVGAVFGWGWFADILNVSTVGPVISFMPILLMGVLFGLAMDYEVFLVARMREDFVHRRREHPHEDPNTSARGAIESGFVGSARVVTAAALIMFAVFAAFVPNGDHNIKPIALGLAIGVAVDAFIVRMTLVPAVLALLGARAWWMPKWLDRVLPHFDVEGEAVQREIALADWPEPESTALAVGLDVGLRERDVTLFEGVSLRVDPGETLIVTGAERRSIHALMLTLAGRLAPTDGTLKVNGQLLPGGAMWVRSKVSIALLSDAASPAAELRHALKGHPRLVVIDGLDVAADASLRDQLASEIRDAAASARAAARLFTLIVGAGDAQVARDILASAGVSQPELLDLSVAATPHRGIPRPHDPSASSLPAAVGGSSSATAAGSTATAATAEVPA